MLYTIKMAQSFKEDPVKYVTENKPSKLVPIAPGLAAMPGTVKALREIVALGFDMSSYQDALAVSQLLADPGPREFIRDLRDNEWPEVYKFVTSPVSKSKEELVQEGPPQVEDTSMTMDQMLSNPTLQSLMETTMERKRPSKRQPNETPEQAKERARMTMDEIMEEADSSGEHIRNMHQSSMRDFIAQAELPEITELFTLLLDVGFAMDKPEIGKAVLQRLTTAKTPSAPIASAALGLDPQTYADIVSTAASEQYKDTTDVVLDDTKIEAPPIPFSDDPADLAPPEEGAKINIPAPQPVRPSPVAPTPQPVKPSPAPPAPAPQVRPSPAPPPAAPAPAKPAALPPVTPTAISVPLPKGVKGNKAFQYMFDEYATIERLLPDEVTPIPRDVGVPGGVLPASSSLGNNRTQAAKGGSMVRCYGTGVMGMIVGATEDGRLALLDNAGNLSLVDPVGAEVRLDKNSPLKPTF